MAKIIALLLMFSSAASVQAIGMDYPMNVSGTSSFDPATHFYEYTYSIGNPLSNFANTSQLELKLQPGVDVVTDIRSPAGWTALYSEEKGVISWAATEVVVPPDYIDDGNVLEGWATIKPGNSLSGFSFKSFSPPGQGTAITQAFAKLPVFANEEEAELQGVGSQLPEDNGYRTTTTVPQPDLDYYGNRRPTVDGFLVFGNLDENSSYSGTALIVIRLAAGGETVYPQTLQVTLNQRDVTAMFVWNAQYNGYAATLTPQNSSLIPGKNVLIAAVDGVVPDSNGHVAKDVDRVTFSFSP